MSRADAVSLLQLLGVEHERSGKILEILKDYADACESCAATRQSLKMMGRMDIYGPASVWSREIPQESGWYWVRRLELGEKPHVIEVMRPKPGFNLMEFREDGREFLFSGVMPGFEFGPRIAEPPA